MKSSVYGAAAGDLSPLLSAGFCDGSQNTTTPNYNMGTWWVVTCPTKRNENLTTHSTSDGGQAPDASLYSGPPCPYTKCNPITCYKVDNIGPVGGPIGKIIGSATVQIIDGCPAGSAWNYW